MAKSSSVMKRVQIIPGLVALDTDASGINCFSFWDNKNAFDFFKPTEDSKYKLEYHIVNTIPIPKGKPRYQFSNLSYFPNLWFYSNRKGPLNLSFLLDEKKDRLIVNRFYHWLFIKFGWLQPAGYVLTDYLTRKLERDNQFYQDGAAARFQEKTFLFFGSGRNFKTTIVDHIVKNGGQYIGEEFFLLDHDSVYATIPNSHRFDFRHTHKSLFSNDLKKRKIDKSTYDRVVFLIYSDRDQIRELDLPQANKFASLYRHECNTHFYRNFLSKDFFEDTTTLLQKPILTNKRARYYVAYFSKVTNIINRLDEL